MSGAKDLCIQVAHCPNILLFVFETLCRALHNNHLSVQVIIPLFLRFHLYHLTFEDFSEVFKLSLSELDSPFVGLSYWIVEISRVMWALQRDIEGWFLEGNAVIILYMTYNNKF